ncbi:hypothetical protein EMCRGX_G017438 [Ephydatia muelleri]
MATTVVPPYMYMYLKPLGQWNMSKVVTSGPNINGTMTLVMWPACRGDLPTQVTINGRFQCTCKYSIYEQLVMTQNQSISIESDNPLGDAALVSGIDQTILLDVCQYPNGDYLCYVLFDVVWALALALNNSVKPLRESGLSLHDYTYGKYAYTRIIQQQMNMLSFSGEWGAVQFNSSTGFISNITCTIYQTKKNPAVVGNFSFPDGYLEVNSSIAVFVSTNFEEKLILVSTPLAVVVIIVEAVAAVLVIWVHILNVVYRHRKTIKASSARLNHLPMLDLNAFIIVFKTHPSDHQ